MRFKLTTKRTKLITDTASSLRIDNKSIKRQASAFWESIINTKGRICYQLACGMKSLEMIFKCHNMPVPTKIINVFPAAAKPEL